VTIKKNESPASDTPLIYVVQEGDSLWKIAQRFGVKVDEIKRLNHFKSDSLKKGTTLKIPKQIAKNK
jgi:LysM repeat protein